MKTVNDKHRLLQCWFYFFFKEKNNKEMGENGFGGKGEACTAIPARPRQTPDMPGILGREFWEQSKGPQWSPPPSSSPGHLLALPASSHVQDWVSHTEMEQPQKVPDICTLGSHRCCRRNESTTVRVSSPVGWIRCLEGLTGGSKGICISQKGLGLVKDSDCPWKLIY